MPPTDLIARTLAYCDALETLESSVPLKWKPRYGSHGCAAVEGMVPMQHPDYPGDGYTFLLHSDAALLCAARNTLRASVGCVRALADVVDSCSDDYCYAGRGLPWKDGTPIGELRPCGKCERLVAALQRFCDACEAAGLEPKTITEGLQSRTR